MIDPRFVLLALPLSVIGGGNYLRETWRGNTQPHRVTWGLWGVEGILAFVVEIQQHVGLVSLLTLLLGFVPCLVLVASFRNPHAVWKIDWIDTVCGVVSLAGLVFWLFVNQPTVALVAFATADTIAALPTIRKSWRSPESETSSAFLLGSLQCLIALLALRQWTTAGALFPFMVMVADASITVLIVTKVGPRLHARRRLLP